MKPEIICEICHEPIQSNDDVITEGGDGYWEPVECGVTYFHRDCITEEFGEPPQETL